MCFNKKNQLGTNPFYIMNIGMGRVLPALCFTLCLAPNGANFHEVTEAASAHGFISQQCSVLDAFSIEYHADL